MNANEFQRARAPPREAFPRGYVKSIAPKGIETRYYCCREAVRLNLRSTETRIS